MNSEWDAARTEAERLLDDFIEGRPGVSYEAVTAAQARAKELAGTPATSATTLEDAVAARFANTDRKGTKR